MLGLLLQTPAGVSIRLKLQRYPETLHAPHLLDLEIAQALRSYVFRGLLTPQRSEIALADFINMAIQ